MKIYFLLPSILVAGALMTGFARAVNEHNHPHCECGYKINATSSSSPFALFTDLLETDFLHLYNLPDSIDVPASEAVGWAVQAYNISPLVARGPFGKAAEIDNVVLNPLSRRKDWTGNGTLGGAPGLQVWVRNQQDLLGPVGDQMVRTGEINSLRRDMRYGSFRVAMKMSDVPGTCAAFFWYRNDSQEIDMEYLSRQANYESANGLSPINLVIQSPASASANYNAINTSTYRLETLPFQPSEGYHEYRFDWTPERIVFFADGKPLSEFENAFDGDAPDAPGTMMLNHWSTGNAGWSGGPPAQDAVLTVSYVKAYFNSSNATRESQWNAACGGEVWRNRTCQIPDYPTQGIDPQRMGMKDPGKSYFFMYDEYCTVNQTLYPAATGGPSKSSGASPLLPTPETWTILGWTAIFGLFLLAS
ncbi:concanavalin A-like lectin/glucanase [Aureobasidium pullulans]|uniref:Concanavalin A-like lectin/glucanase n=1 Tax=Aureobasidium pullulans TaxID=5580 RepID=A0A4V4IWH1_AURPU|nr:concanavalin A-like lectin/glucanase [Aureobasidium pullulans]